MFYKTLSLSDVKREFEVYGRDYFSEEGLEFIEEIMTMGDLDEPIELDVIAICGEFTECSMQTFVSDKGIDFSDFDDDMLIEQFANYTKNHFTINDLKNIPDLENMVEELIGELTDDGYFKNSLEAGNSRINLEYISSYIETYSSMAKVLQYLLGDFYDAFDFADDQQYLLEQYLDNEDINYRFLFNGNIIYCNY